MGLKTPHLSKSRFLSGLQCERRLWLDVHAPEEATPPDDAQQHIFEMGAEIGRAAHALFPGGVLIDAPATTHAEALEATRRAMADPSRPAIFEAAFEFEGVRIRVDILDRLSPEPRWGLREVKSSVRVKPAQHLPDLAIQKWVLEGCGLAIDSAELIHVDKRFVRGAGEIDWGAFFARVELIDELEKVPVDDITARVAEMHRTLARSDAPEREPGAFCKKPHRCNYWDACTASKSADWHIDQTGHKAALKARMHEVVASGRPRFSPELAPALAVIRPPVWALDFEVIAPAIPFYPGTTPYQPLTFQWSLHRLGEDGELEHFEFLADGDIDPQEAVARQLVDVTRRDEGSILAYSGYERDRLEDLIENVPECAEGLRRILRRLVDIHAIVKRHVYHPAFRGSYSIKTVGPALAPHLAYTDLEGVSEGLSALAGFASIVEGRVSTEEARTIRHGLLEYCGLDTEMLMEVYRALVRAAPSLGSSRSLPARSSGTR